MNVLALAVVDVLTEVLVGVVEEGTGVLVLDAAAADVALLAAAEDGAIVELGAAVCDED